MEKPEVMTPLEELVRTNSNNAERDWFGKFPCQKLCDFKVEMPILCNSSRNIRNVMSRIVLPHVFFANLANHFPTCFARVVCRGPQQLREWWSATENDPQVTQNEDLLAVPDYQSCMVPLVFHGDEVPTVGLQKSWLKLIDIISWSSMVSGVSMFDINSIFVIWFVWTESKVITGQRDGFTMEIFWKLISWSFECLFAGKWPERRWDLKPWAADSIDAIRAGTNLCTAHPFRGIIWKIRADLDYYGKQLDLPKHNNVTKPCTWCPAGTRAPKISDNKPSAAWIKMIFTTVQLLGALERINPLLLISGVVSQTLAADYMHIKHMGMDGYFCASVMWLLCYQVLDGTPPDYSQWKPLYVKF